MSTKKVSDSIVKKVREEVVGDGNPIDLLLAGDEEGVFLDVPGVGLVSGSKAVADVLRRVAAVLEAS